MPEIQVLSPHVADLIAAGEVVERPASVVKELMENAFDAGAKTVTVEIMNGGMSLIRVTDDGCGIPAGQAETAFLRHATSKLRDAGDLESIGTLGFRGEALAAICAVSRVELLTRTELGVCLTLEGGAVIQREEAGCPAGTTMIVRDLFFNTPARLKFMKRDQAESAAVFGVIQREALAHPEVAVKFFRDGRQDLLTPGDGLLKSAIYAAFGRDIAMGFTPVRSLGDGISVEGFVSLPVCCRGSRSHQYFFVNGRYVKSLTMQAAVEEAYKNQKMVGKFPGCVIHLSVSLGSVDVNVHPAKTEVKFSDQNRVFSTVHHAVLNALDAGPSRPKAELTPPAPAKQPFRPIGSGQDLPLHAPAPLFSARTADGPVSSPLPLRRRSTEPAVLRDTPRGRFVPAGRAVDVAPPERDFDLAPVPVPVPVPEAPPVPAPKAPRSPEPEVSSMPPAPVPETAPARQEQTPDPVLPLRTPDWTVRGELFLTYIGVLAGGGGKSSIAGAGGIIKAVRVCRGRLWDRGGGGDAGAGRDPGGKDRGDAGGAGAAAADNGDGGRWGRERRTAAHDGVQGGDQRRLEECRRRTGSCGGGGDARRSEILSPRPPGSDRIDKKTTGKAVQTRLKTSPGGAQSAGGRFR